jgi:hypothetical protein
MEKANSGETGLAFFGQKFRVAEVAGSIANSITTVLQWYYNGITFLLFSAQEGGVWNSWGISKICFITYRKIWSCGKFFVTLHRVS